MAKFDAGKTSGGELSTLIGSDAVISGNISLKHSIRIDGQVRGEVSSGETVTIGTTGAVEGNITAGDVVVGGRVKGSITAGGKTTLEETSVLNGDLRTTRLVVHEGAVFNGNSDMSGDRREGHVHPPRKINLTEDEGGG